MKHEHNYAKMLRSTQTLIERSNSEVASENLYVTGCHPRLSCSIEDGISQAVCVKDLLVISPLKPSC